MKNNINKNMDNKDMNMNNNINKKMNINMDNNLNMNIIRVWII